MLIKSDAHARYLLHLFSPRKMISAFQSVQNTRESSAESGCQRSAATIGDQERSQGVATQALPAQKHLRLP